MEFEDLTSEGIENFFWKMLERGWVSGRIEKQSAPLLPGYKCLPYKEGRFSGLDAYSIPGAEGKSAGFMTIWFDKKPIWTMNYGGQYQKEVIPFLKAALGCCIAKRYFKGGRGPGRFTHREYPDLLYVNEISDECSFLRFSGTEKIFDVLNPEELLGWHDYWGYSLL